jgi:hypothetical protein
MNLSTALRLGRVSNLPTVWSNALAGTVLAGAQAWSVTTLVVAVGLSLLYIGGMYLNDAFDRDIDARERPNRPIPAKLVAANSVFAAGFGMLLGGIALVALVDHWPRPALSTHATLSAIALAAAILFYNWNHKGNALSPFFMGLCRVFAYITAGFAAAASPNLGLFLASIISLSYLIGLTYIAKQEALDQLERLWPLLFLAAPLIYGIVNIGQSPVSGGVVLAALTAWIGVALWFLRRRAKGDVPRAVVSLIAGISLVDTLFLMLAGAPFAAALAMLCFVLTLAMQRWISGT